MRQRSGSDQSGRGVAMTPWDSAKLFLLRKKTLRLRRSARALASFDAVMRKTSEAEARLWVLSDTRLEAVQQRFKTSLFGVNGETSEIDLGR